MKEENKPTESIGDSTIAAPEVTPEITDGKPEAEESKSSGSPQFPLWVSVLAILGIYILTDFVGYLIKILMRQGGAIDPQFTVFVIYVFRFVVTICAALWLKANRFGRKTGGRLKFSIKKANPALILWGVVLVVVTSFVLEPLLLLFPAEYMDQLNSAIGTGGWAVLTSVVMAPVLEEILFRGIIQDSLSREYGALRSVLLTSAIFGIIHIIPQQVVNAFFIGIILGYIYVKTKSLVPVILIHAINNAIAFITMLLFDDKALLSTRELISNDTVYWILYGLCAAVFLFAGINLWLQLKKAGGARAEVVKRRE